MKEVDTLHIDEAMQFCSKNIMDQVPDRGACFPEGISMIEEQKKSCDSIEISVPISNEIAAHPVVRACENSLQECAEPIGCNVTVSLAEKNSDIHGTNEVLEEDNIDSYRKNKRQRKELLSEPQTTDLETIEEEKAGSSSPHGMESTSLDQADVENTSEKLLMAGGKLLEEALDCCLSFQNTCSNNNDEVPFDKTNGSMNKNCDSDILKVVEHRTENRIVFNVVSTETGNYILPRVASTDRCCTDSPHLDGVASQNSKESINVEVNRAVAGYTGKKLLVLDVNGLLVDINSFVPYDYDPDDIILKKAVFKRPYCDDFLKFCFEKFNVGVWSSRTKRNVEPILDFLLGDDKRKLLFCWDQSHCTNTGYGTVEKKHKPLLLKKLKKLWDKSDPDLPWEKGVYNESNTLLLDDTPYKALSNPQCTAIFPYTYRYRDVTDNSLGPGGDLRVYLEGLAMADNVQEYVKANPFGQRAITERNLSWGYYIKVIEASSTPPRETEKDEANSTPPQETEKDDPSSSRETEKDDASSTPPRETEKDDKLLTMKS